MILRKGKDTLFIRGRIDTVLKISLKDNGVWYYIAILSQEDFANVKAKHKRDTSMPFYCKTIQIEGGTNLVFIQPAEKQYKIEVRYIEEHVR